MSRGDLEAPSGYPRGTGGILPLSILSSDAIRSVCLFEGHLAFKTRVAQIARRMGECGDILCTSVLPVGETLAGACRAQRRNLRRDEHHRSGQPSRFGRLAQSSQFEMRPRWGARFRTADALSSIDGSPAVRPERGLKAAALLATQAVVRLAQQSSGVLSAPIAVGPARARKRSAPRTLSADELPIRCPVVRVRGRTVHPAFHSEAGFPIIAGSMIAENVPDRAQREQTRTAMQPDPTCRSSGTSGLGRPVRDIHRYDRRQANYRVGSEIVRDIFICA